MLISYFASVFDKIPIAEELGWETFVTKFSIHKEIAIKTNAPAVSPAEWPAQTERKKTQVVQVHLAAIDLDKVPDQTVDRITHLLEPYTYLVHTTWSHTDAQKQYGTSCLRIYVPLSRPVLAHEWPAFWSGLNNYFDGVLDQSCKDPGRLYFVPSAKPGTLAQHFSRHQNKLFLPVEHFLTQRKQILIREKNTNTLPQQLKRLADELCLSHHHHKQEIGERLNRMLAGQVWAQPGERDSILFKLCAVLAEKWPHQAATSLAAFFTPSLAAMNAEAEGAPTFDEVVKKLQRKQQEIIVSSSALSDEDRKRIFHAFKRSRDTPYTEEELDSFAAQVGVNREHFMPFWIIQRGSFYYFFKNGCYSPAYNQQEMANAALTELAPALSAGVSCWRMYSNGTRLQKNERELVRDYGTVAANIVVDMTAQKTYFDWSTNTLIEAPCPMRPLIAEFNEKVDTYLQKLGGASYEKLLDWIACVTLIDRPCAALFLHGVPGGGKGLLAMGLARLWRTAGPSLLKDAFEKFNDSLTSCPLLLADERLPAIFKKEGSTADLRSFIQERSRPLRRKYMPHADLIGSCRLIIASNNQEIFQTGENLSTDDIDAIRDRILDIPVQAASQEYLRSLSTEDLNKFVEGDALAKHALWLRDNRTVVPEGRFMVKGLDSDFHRNFPVSVGACSDVLHWLTCYLQKPHKLMDTDGGIRIEAGELLVTAKCLVENWESYTTNTDARKATARRISSALSSLSTGKKKQLKNHKGVLTNYWPIKTEYVVNWNAGSAIASEEEILSILNYQGALNDTRI